MLFLCWCQIKRAQTPGGTTKPLHNKFIPPGLELLAIPPSAHRTSKALGVVPGRDARMRFQC
eukprot:6213833-Amphidinium_carterae.1